MGVGSRGTSMTEEKASAMVGELRTVGEIVRVLLPENIQHARDMLNAFDERIEKVGKAKEIERLLHEAGAAKEAAERDRLAASEERERVSKLEGELRAKLQKEAAGINTKIDGRISGLDEREKRATEKESVLQRGEESLAQRLSACKRTEQQLAEEAGRLKEERRRLDEWSSRLAAATKGP